MEALAYLSKTISNEMREAIVTGGQKIHDNNTNTNNLDFIFSPNPLESTQPTLSTPITR